MSIGGDTAPEETNLERGPKVGVPGGTGAIRPTATLDDPLAPDETARFEALLGPRSALTEPAALGGEQRTLIIAEDDPALRRLLAQITVNLGFKTFEASDGANVLKFLAGNRLDALVLDIKLPGLNGFQVIRGIRSFLGRRDPAILVITGLADEKDEIAALDLGAEGFLKKPFSLHKFKAHMKSVTRALPERARAS